MEEGKRGMTITNLGTSRTRNWAKTIGLAVLIALAFLALMDMFFTPPCQRRVFGQSECPVGSTVTLTNNLGIQGNTTFTATLTAAPTANRTLTLPDDTSMLVGTSTTQTLSNKTLTSPTLTTSPTAAGATWTDLGTVTTANIDGGTLDGVTIGGTTTGNATFTNATSTNNLAFQGGTAFTASLTGLPTANRTWTFQDSTDTVVGRATTDTFTNKTFDANGTGNSITNIENADIAAAAEVTVSKLADGAARQLLQTDSGGTGVEWASNVDVPGTLDVTGVTVLDSTLTASSGGSLTGTWTDLGSVDTVDVNGGTLSGVTVDGGLTWSAAQDFGSQNLTNVDIDSGTVDGATVGAASASTVRGTTIDATTDFTVGATIITDGVITDPGGLQIDANVDLNNFTLSNVGTTSNSWIATSLTIEGDNPGGFTQLSLLNDSGTADSGARIRLRTVAGGGDPFILFQTTGGGTSWLMGSDNSDSDLFKLNVGTTFSSGDTITVDANSNINLGTAASPGTGTNGLVFPDGTALASLGSNTAGLYADDVAGTVELFAIDEGGSSTQLSPHPADFLATVAQTCAFPWAYHSTNSYLGKEVFVDFCGLVKAVEALTGQQFLFVHDIPASETSDWYDDQEARRLARLAERTAAETRYQFLADEVAILSAKIDVALTEDLPELIERLARVEAAQRNLVVPALYVVEDPPLWLQQRGVLKVVGSR